MPPSVFISYSHKDELWKDRLVTHLGVLEEQNLLRTWTDRNLRAGDLWFQGIQTEIDAAQILVLLVSANSLTSKFILHKEVPRFLESRKQQGKIIFPVLVKDCAWKKVPWLSQFELRPLDGKPLALRGLRIDSELSAIAEEILEILEGNTPAPPVAPVQTEEIGRKVFLAPLHQLPTPPADFTGRQEDLDFLRSHLAPGKTGAIFGLRGMGGVGKTTLALKLAAELKPEFPDAQIYLDLKGVGPHPLTAAQAMAHVILSFHPEARLPEGDAEVAGLYRTVLDGQRVLLLMDNAAGKEQVQPLIPPPTCLLLVTSRFHFVLPGLVDRDLDEMSETEARDLLMRISPRIGDAAGEIAGLCGRLPLALRLAGSALAERLSLSPAGYARRLKEGKERFGDVEAAIDLSYKLLDKEQRRLWRLLAVFPGSFDAKAAAAVWGLDPDATQDGLDELVRISLVDLEGREVRYRLHDLARSFAEKCLETGEREVAQRRFSEHFLEVLRAADDIYLQGGALIAVALKILDTEWGNFQVGHDWAVFHAEKDDTAAKICSDYPDAGAFILELRQHVRERIRWRKLGFAAAVQRNDKAAEGHHLGNLGLCYATLGETKLAIEIYKQDLVMAREIGDRRRECADLGNLGVAYVDLGENLRAIEMLEQQLDIVREIGDRRWESIAFGNMGLAYAALGDHQRAIELYKKQLTITRETGDRRGESNALGGLGIAYADLSEIRRAIETFEQQLAIAHEIGDRRGEGIGSWNLGLAYEKEGNLALASDLMQTFVDYEREIGHADAERDAAIVAALRARIAEQEP